jgi:hypothetical protein
VPPARAAVQAQDGDGGHGHDDSAVIAHVSSPQVPADKSRQVPRRGPAGVLLDQPKLVQTRLSSQRNLNRFHHIGLLSHRIIPAARPVPDTRAIGGVPFVTVRFAGRYGPPSQSCGRCDLRELCEVGIPIGQSRKHTLGYSVHPLPNCRGGSTRARRLGATA